MRFRILIPILLVFSLGLCENPGKSVRTRLHGNWKQTSILAEISEYIASENEELFWEFVELVNQKTNENFEKYSPKSIYDFGISIASELLNPSDIQILRFSLSSRMMSPRVEVHQKLGIKWKSDKCLESFVVFGKQVECDVDQLDFDNYDNELEEEIFSFDHIHPSDSSSSNRTLFVYGSLGSPDFIKNIKKAQKGNIRFVLRHFSTPDPKSHISLSGYGVELAIKNTEYKAVDASKNQEIPENLHGLNFKTLLNLHEDLGKELESLRENLEKLGEIVPLKSWQLKDLGYKTCQKIREFEAIEDIEDLIQDFPIHSKKISNMAMNETFKKSVKDFQGKMESAGIESGKNLLAVNGRIVAMDGRVDLHSFIEIMKEEKEIVEEIHENGLSGNDVDPTKLLTLIDFSPFDLSGYAFDYRSSKPEFLNELESMMGMYKSLFLLLQPFPPGQIRPISRNIFNVILYTDPFDSDDKMFDKIQEYVDSRVFVRFGVVPIFDSKKHGMSIEEALKTKNVDGKKMKIWKTKEKLAEAIKAGNSFLAKSGFQQKTIALLNGYPLDVSSPEAFDISLAENIHKQTTRLQILLYNRIIHDSTKIDEWWLKKANNPDIVESFSEKIATAFNNHDFVELDEKDLNILKGLRYYSENPEILTKNADVTTWIITDFDIPYNRILTAEILKSVASKKNNKIGLISNRIHRNDSCSIDLDETFSLQEVIDILETSQETDYCTGVDPLFLSRYGIRPGDTAIISNQLIIEGDRLKVENFEYLNNLWKEKGAQKAAKYLNSRFSKDMSPIFYSTMAKAHEKNSEKKKEKRIDFEKFKDSKKNNIISFGPKTRSDPVVTVTWIANPVSREGQHLVSIVKLLGKVLNSKVEIIFNPPYEILEMPIKRFYRFVSSESLEFDETGNIENHESFFSNLPQKQLLTMSIETNDGWMIEVKKAEYDLDNLLLETTSKDVEAVFSLEHILVEGQAYSPNREESAGLEIELDSGEKKYDTIVMQNLGYFQLKAEPGVWNLRLRNGSSSEKHQIIKIGSNTVNKKDIQIVVDSFTPKWTELTVKEIRGAKDPEESKIETLMKRAKSYFSTPESSEIINVFSLASGHLYERFMRIMMVSVMKNTKSKKVKFWLLKNYLSPKFKESIPILAGFYGFEYELVEYKWPKWLHQQTEKQRVMWGYKILFLDVLFPLNVDKIIFVDADQVVRADLLELMNLDLGGAPYGYVPFCESRKEMDGFRFWKSGYWNNHMMGRSYHISALYVVDLKAFRLFSAGDRLRGRYDSLSADPNSLSNLDQDLPNNMIHEVPIKSLPQDWLWCETWCSDESKTTAKTIDLCNNPLTKEPKLNSAQRIIGEWKTLDEEISDVIKTNGKGKMMTSLEKEEL